ncbi:TnsA endonuclease N-terminal domain-containing protein [Deinococcus radiopugnans]
MHLGYAICDCMVIPPVRKIIKGRRGNRGRIGALKAGGRATFESTLERDFYFTLDFDPAVETFSPQPVLLTYQGSNGRKKKYVPDVLVTYTDRRPHGLFEVKYAADLLADPSEFRLKFRAAREYARCEGWTFGTVTEKSIRQQRLKNITFLRPFLDPGRVFAARDRQMLLCQFTVIGLTPRQLLADLSLEEKGRLLPVLWHLVAAGVILLDMDQPLGMDSPLHLPEVP